MKTTTTRQTAQPVALPQAPHAAPQTAAALQAEIPVHLQRAERLGHDFARTSVTAQDLAPRDPGRPLPDRLRRVKEREKGNK